MKRWGFAVVLCASTLAWAGGPEAVVRTTDGSVYYGELVERVESDHVTILLATGVRKHFAWKDIDPSPIPTPPRVLVEEPRPGPTVTVRTKSGGIYHGEIVEDVPNDHITLKLATGDLRQIARADIDASPPPPPRTETQATAPVENVITKNGSIYHGEILEKVVRDHVTLRLATGEIKTVDWEDIEVAPQHTTQPVVVEPVEPATTLTFMADKGAELQRFDAMTRTYTTLCKSPCDELASDGEYRVGGDGFQPTRSFFLGAGSNRIEASMAPRALHTVGLALAIASVPTFVTGLALLFAATSAATSAGGPTNNAPLDVMTVATNVVGTALLGGGVYLFYTAASHVTVNERTVARLSLDGVHF